MRTRWCAQLHVYIFFDNEQLCLGRVHSAHVITEKHILALCSSWLTLQPEAFLQGEERKKKPQVGLRGLSRQPILLRQRKQGVSLDECCHCSSSFNRLDRPKNNPNRVDTACKKPALHSALKEEKKKSPKSPAACPKQPLQASIPHSLTRSSGIGSRCDFLVRR